MRRCRTLGRNNIAVDSHSLKLAGSGGRTLLQPAHPSPARQRPGLGMLGRGRVRWVWRGLCWDRFPCCGQGHLRPGGMPLQCCADLDLDGSDVGLPVRLRKRGSGRACFGTFQSVRRCRPWSKSNSTTIAHPSNSTSCAKRSSVGWMRIRSPRISGDPA